MWEAPQVPKPTGKRIAVLEPLLLTCLTGGGYAARQKRFSFTELLIVVVIVVTVIREVVISNFF